MNFKSYIRLLTVLVVASLVTIPSNAFSSDQSTTLTPTEVNIPTTADIARTSGKLSFQTESAKIKTFEVKKESKPESQDQVEELKMSAMMVTVRVEAKALFQEERATLQKSVTATQFAVVDQKLKESLNQVTGYEEGSDGKLKKDYLVEELEIELAYNGTLSVESVRETRNEKNAVLMEMKDKDPIYKELDALRTIYKITNLHLKTSMNDVDDSKVAAKEREEKVDDVVNKFLKKLDEAVASVRAFYLPQAPKGDLKISEIRKEMRKYTDLMLNASTGAADLTTPELKIYFLDLAKTSYSDIYPEMKAVDWEDSKFLENNQSLLVRFFDFYQMRHPWLNILLSGKYATKAEIDYLAEIIDKLYNEKQEQETLETEDANKHNVQRLMLQRMLMPLAALQKNEINDFWLMFAQPENIERTRATTRKVYN